MKSACLLLALAVPAFPQTSAFQLFQSRELNLIAKAADIHSGFLALGQTTPVVGSLRCDDETDGRYVLEVLDSQQIVFSVRTQRIDGRFVLKRDDDGRDHFGFSGYWTPSETKNERQRIDFDDPAARIIYPNQNQDEGLIIWGSEKSKSRWKFYGGGDPASLRMTIELFGKSCDFTRPLDR